MLADICQNVVRGPGAPVYVSGSSLLLDAGQASSYSSGTAWVDLSGNGYDMTWTGGYGRGGSADAAYFTTDGINGTHAQRASQTFYGTAQTWSGWFYATQDTTQRLMEEALAGINQISLTWTAGGLLQFNGYDTVSYRFQTPTTGGASGLAQSTWYHVAGIYDGTTAYLYINGVLASSVAQTGSITSAATTFRIGELSGGGQAWKGRIAQVILYASALTAAQNATNFNAVCTRYGYSAIGTKMWTSGAASGQAIGSMGSAGTKTAALIWGGSTGGDGFSVQTFNGTAWGTGTSLSTSRSTAFGSSNGTQTAALAVGGYDYTGAGDLSSIEAYNGSAWTAGTAFPTTVRAQGGAGTSTSCLIAGGITSGASSVVKSYNGSAWTAQSAISSARYSLAGCGASSSSAIVAGGNTGSVVATVETFNGSAWTTGTSLPAVRHGMGIAGTQANLVAFGGYNATVANRETWTFDGSAWSQQQSLLTIRGFTGNAGTSSSAMVTAGQNAGGNLSSTETFA